MTREVFLVVVVLDQVRKNSSLVMCHKIWSKRHITFQGKTSITPSPMPPSLTLISLEEESHVAGDAWDPHSTHSDLLSYQH